MAEHRPRPIHSTTSHTSTPPTGVALDGHESTKSPQYLSDSSPYIPLPAKPSTPTSSQRSSPPATIPTDISLNDPLARVNLHLSNVDSNGGFGHIIQGDQINNFYRNENESKALRELAQKAAPNACYDSEQRFPPPNCHEGTRVQMIADISNWIEDNSKTTRVLWIHGTAGIGKSAIAQHISEKYAETRLAAAFFFSRNDSTRDNINPFIASIAYQLCKVGSLSHPKLRSKIIEAISVDPNVFQASCEVQLRNLIIEPCLRVDPPSWNVMRNLLVVDGLDECVDLPSQKRVLELILRLISAVFPSSWIVLLCSRPESQIQDAVEQIRSFRGFLKAIDMNTSEELNRDIARYFNAEFSRLRRKYQRVLGVEGAVWPEDHVIDELVRRADKQMIFAVTVIRYIDTPYELPQDQLETVRRIVVETGTGSPYSALDTLYHQILKTCGKWERVQPILRLLITPHELPESYDEFFRSAWRSPAMIAQLLNLKEAEVYLVLDRLHSVLRLPGFMGDSEIVRIAHATFKEFLVDLIRSACFHTPQMSKSEYYDCCATSSLKTLSDLAQYYPPYHSQSFTEALSVWQQKRQGIYDRGLSSFVAFGWALCKEVTTPASLALVQALSTFDPYPLMTLVVSWGLERHMSRDPFYVSLRTHIKWAKSQGPTVSFAKKLKSFVSIKEYYVAFPPDTTGNAVFHGSFHAESILWYGKESKVGKVYREILPPPDIAEDNIHCHFLILPPASSQTSATVPDDWIVVRNMNDNAKSCSRADVIRSRDEEMFIRDIMNNTRESISLGLVKERDVVRIRRSIQERLEIVRRLPLDYKVGVDPKIFWSQWGDGIEANADTNDSDDSESEMDTDIDNDSDDSEDSQHSATSTNS